MHHIEGSVFYIVFYRHRFSAIKSGHDIVPFINHILLSV